MNSVNTREMLTNLPEGLDPLLISYIEKFVSSDNEFNNVIPLQFPVIANLLLQQLLSQPVSDLSNDKKEELIKLALENKADPNLITNLYSLPSESIVDLLLQHGWDVSKALSIISNINLLKYDTSSNTYITYGEDEAVRRELIKKLINAGADVNYNLDGDTLLESIEDPAVIDLLKSYGAKCSNRFTQELIEADLEKVLNNPELIFEQKYKYLSAQPSPIAKIPYIIHHIWLTTADNPNEIRDQDLNIVLNNKNIFLESPVTWNHIVWTNNKNLIPKSTKVLEDNGIIVQSIYDYQDSLSMFELVEGLINKKKWGMASDALRYSLVEKFGGIYSDLNFVFNRDMTLEVHTYNFFSKTLTDYTFDNFIFAASPFHPIMKRVIELVEKNLSNPPYYIASIKQQDGRIITDLSTASPIYLAYYHEANKAGNIDVVYPMTEGNNHYYNVKTNKGDLICTENTWSFSQSIDPLVYSIVLEQQSTTSIVEKHKCPEDIAYKKFTHYVQNNEICGSEIHNIGYDSQDGVSWI